jgi:WD40 repeat protein
VSGPAHARPALYDGQLPRHALSCRRAAGHCPPCLRRAAALAACAPRSRCPPPLPPPSCAKVFTGHQHTFERLLLRCCWSPDGKRVAAGSADRIAYIWDADTCQLAYALPGHKGSVNDVAFHPKVRGLPARLPVCLPVCPVWVPARLPAYLASGAPRPGKLSWVGPGGIVRPACALLAHSLLTGSQALLGFSLLAAVGLPPLPCRPGPSTPSTPIHPIPCRFSPDCFHCFQEPIVASASSDRTIYLGELSFD